MVERLRQDTEHIEELTIALKSFANEGLRTLVLAQRQLREEDWRVWDEVRPARIRHIRGLACMLLSNTCSGSGPSHTYPSYLSP
jgi:hypothetical protein